MSSPPPSRRMSGGPPSQRMASAGPASQRPRPASGRPPSGRPPSGRPVSAEARLDEALADAEKMARRVEVVAETDVFAAALLAHEFLARLPERDVNPLDQRGRTDAWTSAFVRLRIIADRGAKLDGFTATAKSYVEARAEERRLDSLLGRDAKTTLARAREAQRRGRHKQFGRAVGLIAVLVGAALIAVMGAGELFPERWMVTVGAGVLVAIAIGLFAWIAVAQRALSRSAKDIAHIEHGLTERAVFDSSPTGRPFLRDLQDAHPLLVRGPGARSSIPPPAEVRR